MKRVLIVDDEMDICLLLKKILQKTGLEVRVANDLMNGYTMFTSEDFDIVFLDLNLPDGSGFDMLKKIKQQKPFITVIINSAYDGLNERMKARQLGADYFVGKPFSKQQILDALSAVSKT